MLFDPIPYSVTIGAIAFTCFAILSIARPTPIAKTEFSTFPQLPEPIQPLALLPAAPSSSPELTANSIEVIEYSLEPISDKAIAATPPRLPSGLDSRELDVSGFPVDPEPHLLYPTAIPAAKDYPTIPSPWDASSDHFWGQNPTVTYPNAPAGLLPGDHHE